MHEPLLRRRNRGAETAGWQRQRRPARDRTPTQSGHRRQTRAPLAGALVLSESALGKFSDAERELTPIPRTAFPLAQSVAAGSGSRARRSGIDLFRSREPQSSISCEELKSTQTKLPGRIVPLGPW